MDIPLRELCSLLFSPILNNINNDLMFEIDKNIFEEKYQELRIIRLETSDELW